MSLPFYTLQFLRSRAIANENGCLIWQGSKTTNGYAYVGPNQMGTRSVHVLMWIHTHGERPEGMDLDHLCRNRDCINPEHLEAVSHAENMRRGIARCSKQTHCRHGHPFVDGSYYLYRGKRICKECNTIKCRKYQQNKAASAALQRS